MGDFNQIDVQTAITRLLDIGATATPVAYMVNGIKDQGLLGSFCQECKFERMLSVDDDDILETRAKRAKNIWSGKAKIIEISDMDKRISARFIAVTG